MTSSIDLATALDHVLGDPNTEAKFQALKTLHAKKIKSLMSSIDTKERELERLKALGKDNRRTEIIQSLKKKLKHHELVIHVMKEEMIKKGKLEYDEADQDPISDEAKNSLISVDVNNFIIGKTISGPKRFRPLTREELENQIAELEKKLELERKMRLKLSASASATSSKTLPGSGPGPQSKSLKSSAAVAAGSGGVGTTSGNSTEQDLRTMIDISDLQDQIVSLNQEISSRDDIISKQKEEIFRIRAGNSSLHSLEEEMDTLDASYKELSALHQRTMEDLEDTTQQLAASQEEKFQIQANAEQDIDQANLEIENLRDQCEQGLKQNTQLLRLMANLETKMMNNGSGTSTAKNERHVSPSKNLNASGEAEVIRLTEKLKASTLRVHELEKGMSSNEAALRALKDTLRDKNEEIRILQRNIFEISRHNDAIDNTRGGGSAGSQGKGGQGKGGPALSMSAVAVAEAKAGGGREQTTPRDSKGSKTSSPRPS